MSEPTAGPIVQWARDLPSTLAAGLLVGGLYGGAICGLHLLHNQLGARDITVLAFWMSALYGLWAVACFFAGSIISALGRSLPFKFLRRTRSTSAAGATGTLAGLVLFQLMFWQPALLYGLTYEQTVLFRPRSFVGMALYILVASILVTAAVLVASLAQHVALAKLFSWPRPSTASTSTGTFRRAASVVAILAAVSLVALWVLGLLAGPQHVEAKTAEPPGEIRAAAGRENLRIALIGLDGADPRVLEQLISDGRLPTFARLVREGTQSDLGTLPDANSAVIWASIYTGTSPDQHGIHDFYRIHLPGLRQGVFPVHRTYWKEIVDRLERYGLAHRSVVTRGDLFRPPIWEVLDYAQESAGVVDGYLYSFPAFKPKNPDSFFLAYGSDGFSRMLSRGDLGLSDLHLFVQPKETFPLVRDVLDQPDFDWQSDSLLSLLHGAATSGASPPRLLNLYTHEPDSVQHQTWRDYQPQYYPPRTPDPEQASLIPERYVAFDHFLARLMEQLDAADQRDGRQTVLVVVSDHGHVPTIVHPLDTQHRHGPPGILLMRGGPTKAGYTLDSSHVLDIFPTLLHLLGLPVSEDSPGRVLEEAFEPDFRAQKVRSIPSWSFLESDAKGGTSRSRMMDREEIEKLRRLGYL